MRKALPKTVQTLLDKLEPQMRDAFLAAIKEVKNAIQLQVVIDHLEAGRLDQAVAALRLDDAFFDPVVRILGEAYYLGGRDAIARLPSIPDPFTAGATSLLSTAERPAPKRG